MLSGNTIKSLQLTNLQSWSDSGNKLEFSDTSVNVLQARSETGKSVFRKVFALACFPSLYGAKGRRAIIRRGCSSGSLQLVLSNDTMIEFVIEEKKIIYKMKAVRDSDWRVWETPAIPQEITDELGWYVDGDSRILLNIIDNDHGNMFIDTTPKANAAVLKHLTDEPRVTQAKDTVNEWIDMLSESMVKIEPVLLSLKREVESRQFVDAAKIEGKLLRCREIAVGWAGVENTLALLTSVSEVVKTKPVGAMRDLRTAEQCFRLQQKCGKVIDKFTEVHRLVCTKPDCSVEHVDFALGDSIVHAITSAQTGRHQLEILQQHVEGKPLKPPDTRLAEPYYRLSQASTHATELFREVLKALQDYFTARKALGAGKKKLKEVEEALGVCPVCGSRLCKHDPD